MKAQWILILTLLFALVTAVFAVINVDPVRVNYVFGERDIPLILVILGSVLLGGLITGFIGLFRQFKLKRQIRLLEKKLAEYGSGQAAPVPSDGTSLQPAEDTAAKDSGI
ncbi:MULTISPECIES: LapA family protein [Paenibacillus]|uniref:LapA family protein n=1 Tax=Paenibacillus TaxID=44249 RepID=UPI0022B8E2A1|nr:lipopolysaccharide assembly protein LapA domain-containing protein [Paenibacillus caseinilyticus]MCZ8518064.1 lipopolysaccharide assembly protein LapA domain-containing protein [Paenibacillus caseinilyticus]